MNDPEWDKMFGVLQAFKASAGHGLVPDDYHAANGLAVARWLAAQRKCAREGTLLNQSRLQRLSSLGALGDEGSVTEDFDDPAALHSQRVLAAPVGHVPSPTGEFNRDNDDDETNTASSLQDPFTAEPVLSSAAESASPLETAHPQAPKKSEASTKSAAEKEAENHWEEMFRLLVKFKNERGHIHMYRRHMNENPQLYRWWLKQRRKKREGTLDAKKVESLTSMGMIWDDTYTQQQNIPCIGKFESDLNQVTRVRLPWGLPPQTARNIGNFGFTNLHQAYNNDRDGLAEEVVARIVATSGTATGKTRASHLLAQHSRVAEQDFVTAPGTLAQPPSVGREVTYNNKSSLKQQDKDEDNDIGSDISGHSEQDGKGYGAKENPHKTTKLKRKRSVVQKQCFTDDGDKDEIDFEQAAKIENDVKRIEKILTEATREMEKRKRRCKTNVSNMPEVISWKGQHAARVAEVTGQKEVDREEPTCPLSEPEETSLIDRHVVSDLEDGKDKKVGIVEAPTEGLAPGQELVNICQESFDVPRDIQMRSVINAISLQTLGVASTTQYPPGVMGMMSSVQMCNPLLTTQSVAQSIELGNGGIMQQLQQGGFLPPAWDKYWEHLFRRLLQFRQQMSTCGALPASDHSQERQNTKNVIKMWCGMAAPFCEAGRLSQHPGSTCGHPLWGRLEMVTSRQISRQLGVTAGLASQLFMVKAFK